MHENHCFCFAGLVRQVICWAFPPPRVYNPLHWASIYDLAHLAVTRRPIMFFSLVLGLSDSYDSGCVSGLASLRGPYFIAVGLLLLYIVSVSFVFLA